MYDQLNQNYNINIMCGICYVNRNINIHNHIFNFHFFADYLTNDYVSSEDIQKESSLTLNNHVLKENLLIKNVNIQQCRQIAARGPDQFISILKTKSEYNFVDLANIKELQYGQSIYCQSVLGLRGSSKTDKMMIHSGVLLYNGEIYNSKQTLSPKIGESDTIWLYHNLSKIKSSDINQQSNLIKQFLSNIRGDYAFVYERGNRIFIAKDYFGKKSLLLGFQENGVILTSQPIGSIEKVQEKNEIAENQQNQTNWREKYKSQYTNSYKKMFFQIPKNTLITIDIKEDKWIWSQQHIYQNLFIEKSLNEKEINLQTIIKDLTRILLQSIYELISNIEHYEHYFENGIKQKQNSQITQHQTKGHIVVLFSGGLDSTLIARLLDITLPIEEQIDLVNLVFQQNAPDRITAIRAYEELKSISPNRKFNLLLQDKSIQDLYLTSEVHLKKIYPKNTHMDFNISGILYTACSLEGYIYKDEHKNPVNSASRIVLSGLGADQIFSGYSRYRVAFNRGGYEELERQMNFDMDRLWIRNLGRDDRAISSRGKQARYPFLYAPLVQYVKRNVNFKLLTDYSGPKGYGDKILLRKVGQGLGLKVTSTFKKTAIQFGTRFAKQSNIKMFGSNRKAKGTYKFQNK